jgi:hypothetical protein
VCVALHCVATHVTCMTHILVLLHHRKPEVPTTVLGVFSHFKITYQRIIHSQQFTALHSTSLPISHLPIYIFLRTRLARDHGISQPRTRCPCIWLAIANWGVEHNTVSCWEWIMHWHGRYARILLKSWSELPAQNKWCCIAVCYAKFRNCYTRVEVDM